MNPIVDLSISIPICLPIAFLLLLGFIIPTLIVTVLGPRLVSSTSTLALLYLDKILLVSRESSSDNYYEGNYQRHGRVNHN